MKIKLIELPLLGTENPPYNQRRMSEKEMKRTDIDPIKLYLVNYRGVWLLGRFCMQLYGWYFNPNLGSMGMQVNDLKAIFEVIGLNQEKGGSTTGFITSYL